MSLNRGKRSMTLNLKLPEAQELFKEMVKRVDLMLENYRPLSWQFLLVLSETLIPAW
jgi:crotonobetainyl-CoA:carnitine CoA-transferase CaiB-like acyl-CoA transferase